MSIISWNCRGSGGSTISTLNRYLRCTKASIAFISETKCDTRRSLERIKCLSLCNSIIVPSKGSSGRLWLLWEDNIKITVLEQDKYIIAVEVVEKGKSDPWLLLGVYGDPTKKNSTRIWERIEGHIANDGRPALILGVLQRYHDGNREIGRYFTTIGPK